MSNNWDNKREAIASYYSGLIAEHGYGPRACDYGRPESQQKKFKVLSDVIQPNHKTLLDVGCGFADYGDYLKEAAPHLEYHGVDITQDFIAYVQEHKPHLKVEYKDVLKADVAKHDVVMANGIFYLLGEDAENTMQTLVSRMFELTNHAVAFNSLSAWCDDQEAGEFYADPIKTLEFCRTLTPWVTLRHDYHSRDFTIYMYREQIG